MCIAVIKQSFITLLNYLNCNIYNLNVYLVPWVANNEYDLRTAHIWCTEYMSESLQLKY